MKKLLLTLACTLATFACFAQGTVLFSVRVPADGIDAKVSDSTGAFLSGTGFSAQLYGGAVGTAETALKPLGGVVNFRTGAGAGYALSPTPSTIAIPGVAGGTKATLQLRAWDNSGGATSWEAATVKGSSKLFDVTTGNPDAVPPGTPANLVGLTSFSLAGGTGPVVPEPSTIALGVLGAAALLARRRK